KETRTKLALSLSLSLATETLYSLESCDLILSLSQQRCKALYSIQIPLIHSDLGVALDLL
ncbi:hypothetical protein GIB67_040015, partial [Kingdonia uniflora]